MLRKTNSLKTRSITVTGKPGKLWNGTDMSLPPITNLLAGKSALQVWVGQMRVYWIGGEIIILAKSISPFRHFWSNFFTMNSSKRLIHVFLLLNYNIIVSVWQTSKGWLENFNRIHKMTNYTRKISVMFFLSIT